MWSTLLQKTYTVDFLSGKWVKNNGIVPLYYVENSHEPIVPQNLYMQVQEEMVRKANLHSGAKRNMGDVAGERRQRIEEMRAFLEKQANGSLAYDAQLMWRLVGKITVYENRLMVEFGSGLVINVEG